MKIVFIGDSITVGYGIPFYANWLNNLTNVLKDECINKGINGDTTKGILERFDKDVIGNKPDMVHIMAGVNDFISDSNIDIVKNNINQIVDMARKENIDIIIGVPPQIIDGEISEEWRNIANYVRVKELLAEYRDFLIEKCYKENISYIDYYKLMEAYDKNEDITKLYMDGIHPNELGNELLFKIFLEKAPNITRK